ncbi:transposase [uncultured Ilyobacter sp.]|uniref:transposase n=1 Tax=uncultured Ilyobacter sp. TaxID=544433 RepID=UPI0029C6BB58|nr:transposase [uncultured Ilyobacter sp.]
MNIQNSVFSSEDIKFKTIGESDPVISTLEWLCYKLMDVEFSFKVGALISERKLERSSYRSGYRPKRFDTRIGPIHLKVPKLRKGGYIPFFSSDRVKSEIELLKVVKEAYITKVSEQKINKLAVNLGMDYITDEQTSKISKELNKYVNEQKNACLEKLTNS